MNLALNNLQWLIYHKTKINQTHAYMHTHTHTHTRIYIYIYIYSNICRPSEIRGVKINKYKPLIPLKLL